MYQLPDAKNWKGRTDILDGQEGMRWHHAMQLLDLSNNIEAAQHNTISIAFLGFCCDEGVRRNLGRVGAKEGPLAIRKALRNFAVHFKPERLWLFDAGDVICPEENLEAAQELLGKKIHQLLTAGYHPIVLGGGHEIAYGHFNGIHAFTQQKNKSAGIINLDAHFDLRRYEAAGTSGTPFLQINNLLNQHGQQLHYLVLGINEAANTKALFNTATTLGVHWHPYAALTDSNLENILSAIKSFANKVDYLYLSLDLDVISEAHAPGVSAPATFGVQPHIIRMLLREIIGTNKMISFDIAELNPNYDIDGRTARLAAHMIYDVITVTAGK